MKKISIPMPKKLREQIDNYTNYQLTPDGFKYLVENNEIYIKGFKKGSPAEIPAYIDNMPVVYLAGLHGLPLSGTVRIPDTVRELEWAVFNVQELAEEFLLPESLVRIDEHAFAWCKSLKKISFPDSVSELGLGTVMSCKKLESLRLPADLEEIPECFASGCSSLEKISIPDSVKIIKFMAFNDCGNLTEIKFSSQLERIEKYAFCDCTSLKKITLPDSVRYIGKFAFAGCSQLERPELPENCEVHPKAFRP